MVDLFDFDEVDDGHRDVDVDRDVEVLHLVKAEGSNLLVVVVLDFTEGQRNIVQGERNVWLHPPS